VRIRSRVVRSPNVSESAKRFPSASDRPILIRSNGRSRTLTRRQGIRISDGQSRCCTSRLAGNWGSTFAPAGIMMRALSLCDYTHPHYNQTIWTVQYFLDKNTRYYDRQYHSPQNGVKLGCVGGLWIVSGCGTHAYRPTVPHLRRRQGDRQESLPRWGETCGLTICQPAGEMSRGSTRMKLREALNCLRAVIPSRPTESAL